MGNLSVAQSTIAQWTFETSQPTTPGPISPETGSGSASGSHAEATASYASTAGNGSAHCYSSTKWTAGDYWQFQVSASNYKNITIAYDQTGSNSGPGTFQLQVSTDGINFTDIGSPYTVTNDSWSATGSQKTASHHSETLASSYDNSAVLYIRLTDASATAINGSSVATSGTSRIDNVTVSAASITPVLLDSFNVTRSGTGALLRWTTKTEINSSYFTVTKSADGKTFFPIGTVAALNNPAGGRYSYTDNAYQNGTAYYRLEMADLDGMQKLSGIVAIGADTQDAGRAVILNTVVDDRLWLNVLAAGTLHVRVLNVSGKILQQYLISGTGKQSVDIGQIPKGVYIVQLSMDGWKSAYKIVRR